MNKELDEMRESVAKFLFKTVFKGNLYKWEDFNDNEKEGWYVRVDQILSLETDTCRIAVVKRKGELPKLVSLTGVASIKEKSAYVLGVKDSQEQILAKHFVQEVVQEHHIWCNNFMKPHAGCKLCAELYEKYPYEGLSPDELLKKHFPGVIKRVEEVKDA